MNEYQINPKTKGSKVLCCVPQHGRCPVKCSNCFFQPNKETGKSRAYLGENYEFTPNIPPNNIIEDNIIRVNDCNDSNNNKKLVIETTKNFKKKFFNTSIPKNLEEFIDPVVLTVNPAKMTDKSFHKLNPIPKNLMFVRARVNTWNVKLIDKIVNYYSENNIYIILTFMAYYETNIPKTHEVFYSYRKRTLNSYWVINPECWNMISERYKENKYVKTCGLDALHFSCTDCRNCENLYYEIMQRL